MTLARGAAERARGSARAAPRAWRRYGWKPSKTWTRPPRTSAWPRSRRSREAPRWPREHRRVNPSTPRAAHNASQHLAADSRAARPWSRSPAALTAGASTHHPETARPAAGSPVSARWARVVCRTSEVNISRGRESEKQCAQLRSSQSRSISKVAGGGPCASGRRPTCPGEPVQLSLAVDARQSESCCWMTSAAHPGDR